MSLAGGVRSRRRPSDVRQRSPESRSKRDGPRLRLSENRRPRQSSARRGREAVEGGGRQSSRGLAGEARRRILCFNSERRGGWSCRGHAGAAERQAWWLSPLPPGSRTRRVGRAGSLCFHAGALTGAAVLPFLPQGGAILVRGGVAGDGVVRIRPGRCHPGRGRPRVVRDGDGFVQEGDVRDGEVRQADAVAAAGGATGEVEGRPPLLI